MFSERLSAMRPEFQTSCPASFRTLIWYDCCTTPRSSEALICQLNRGCRTSIPSGVSAYSVIIWPTWISAIDVKGIQDSIHEKRKEEIIGFILSIDFLICL